MLLGWVLLTGNLYGQVIQNDTLNSSVQNDTLPGNLQVKGDTLSMAKEKGDIETTIKYSAKDSIRMDVVSKKVYLYGDAKINYGDITLTAALVSIDWQNSMMTANALPDSTGKLRGIPVFTQAGEPYEAEEIQYNFKTKKGIISNIVTKQGEGFVEGEKVKRTEDAIYISSAKYTTCNLSHPHFYINARKLKVIPEDKVVSGPFNMVISDVQLPLGFFLGFFPIPKKQKSGIIFPTFGMSAQRGLFLSRGGYYLAVNDYLNFKVIGDAYSNGSYNATFSSDYNVRYKYNGNFTFTGAKNKQTFGLEEKPQSNYNLTWNHKTAPKRNRSFTASVSVFTGGFFKNNSFNAADLNRNTASSNILYSKGFGGTPFSITVNARQDENIKGTKTVMNFTLPEVNFNMSRITPFKKKASTGEKWYEKLNVLYTLNTKYFSSNLPISFGIPLYIPPNSSPTLRVGTDTIDLTTRGFVDILRSGQWGARHSIPISTTVKILKYFTFTPMFTYNQYFFDRYLDYQFNENPTKARVVKGFTSTYDYNFTNSFRTNLYGTYNLKSKRLLAIRHTAIPVIGHRYNPDFTQPQYNNFERGFTNGNENTTLYNRFAGAAYVPQAAGGFNGLTFSVSNTVEGKVRSRQDTANPIKKINLINNIGISGSYNFVDKANKHLNLSNIAIIATTTLFKAINITFNSTIFPYKNRLDSINSITGTVSQTEVNPKYIPSAERSAVQLKRSQEYQLAIGGSLNPKAFKPKTVKTLDKRNLDLINPNPDLYVDFNIPWNLNINYNFRYQRLGFAKSTFTQSLQVSGDLKVSQNWKIAFTSGYDFVQKGIALTQLTINRDLHCWQMSFTVIPFGLRQSYFFTISAKSSILQDLKLNKRSPAFYGY